MLLGGFAHPIEDDARLDDGYLLLRVEGNEAAHVLREVEDDGDIAALTGETGARTRGRMAAPSSRQAAIAAWTSAASRGRTTPMGVWR